MKPDLKINLTHGSQVTALAENAWRLEIPAGKKGQYRLAQLDDYEKKPRASFPWRAPFSISLQARASSPHIPGTWGFGLWNNPFGMAIFRGAELLRLPALPNAAWFFFSSPENYLSLRNDLPAQGGTAGTFRSPRLPPPLLLPGLLALPFLLLPPTARLLRRLGRFLVRQSSVALTHTPTDWHTYEINWQKDLVYFTVDGEAVLKTRKAPSGPLGLVLWVDNQYAAFRPDGKAAFGTLVNPEPAWIEVAEIQVESGLNRA